MKISNLYKPFFNYWFLNYIVTYIPFWSLRKLFFKIFSSKIGFHAVVDMGCFVIDPSNLHIGNYTHINRKCLLDSRGCIYIGDNVSISHNVTLCTGSHDCNSLHFDYVSAPIRVCSYAWIGINATILPGVTVGEGAVVAAGAVLTHNAEPYGIYAGIPAKKIGERKREMEYYPGNLAYFRNKYRRPYFQ